MVMIWDDLTENSRLGIKFSFIFSHRKTIPINSARLSHLLNAFLIFELDEDDETGLKGKDF